MVPAFWSVEPIWRGERVVLLGGGPSLTQQQVDACRGRARVIAVNNSYLLAPWADLLYACDRRWWDWHAARPEFAAFAGLKVGLHDDTKPPLPPGVLVLRRGPNRGLAERPDTVALGSNGGYQAVNLAVHLGARLIVLLGFDMRAVDGQVNWHRDHPVPDRPRIYDGVMIPAFEALAPVLRARGIEVLNATPGSALRAFPMVKLEDALNGRSVAA